MAESSSSLVREWRAARALVATHDAIESLARRPLVVLAVATFLALVVFVLVTSRSLPLVGGLLTALGLGCVGPWLAIAGVRGSIRFERRRCRVGETIDGIVTTFGRSGLRGLGIVDGETGVSLGPLEASLGNDRRLVLRPAARGRFPRMPPAVESDAPFGLVRAWRALEVDRPIVVWPITVPVRFPAALVDAVRHGRELSDRVAGSAGDVLGVRPYRPGDTVRAIHWAHTARQDAVMVRERPGAGGPTVHVIVDRLAPPGLSDAAWSRTLDALVATAASLVESWVPRGIAVDLEWAGSAIHRPRTRRGLEAALDALACLEPATRADDVALAVPSHPRATDLDICLTTPGRRALFAGTRAGAPRAAGGWHPRLLVMVDPSGADLDRAPRGMRREDEIELVLPIDRPAATLDRLLAEIGHDPDAPRS